MASSSKPDRTQPEIRDPTQHTPTSTPSSSYLSNPTNHPLRLSALQYNEIVQPILNNHTAPSPPSKPEKCLTFCSQRNDAQPICRMFCLRRRPIRTTQSEDLAKLRSSFQPKSVDNVIPRELSTSGWSWTSPFDGLRKTLEPYSFIYARGTPDGVVGRYMEELEYDDGVRDFGGLSRHATELPRRTWEDDKLEVLNWGTEG
jgi:hypothetical protein